MLLRKMLNRVRRGRNEKALSSDMLARLKEYYSSNGIASTNFTCSFKNDCARDCENFTGPKATFVSREYENGKLPRLLFLSLDSGSGNLDPFMRTAAAVRQIEEDRNVDLLHKSRHWYRTHELAWYVLRQFCPELLLEDAKHYFAHANSAKCSMNKPQRAKADSKLFVNCRTYLGPELEMLRPDILITQGQEAQQAVQSILSGIDQTIDEYARVIRLFGRQVFWLHTFHPNNYGRFNAQRRFNNKTKIAEGWEHYAELIYGFVNQGELPIDIGRPAARQHKSSKNKPDTTSLSSAKTAKSSPSPVATKSNHSTHRSDVEGIEFVPTMKRALEQIGAIRPDPFAWVAYLGNIHVITVEVDHRDSARNVYDPENGTFHKVVPPLTRENGKSPNTIRHAQQLLDSIVDTYREDKTCRVLFVKGTKSGTTRGGTKAAIDPHPWVVDFVQGAVRQGFEFQIRRQRA